MKLSQDLCITFWLRRQNMNKNSKATIMLRVMIDGEYKDLSLDYQVEPERFDNKSASI